MRASMDFLYKVSGVGSAICLIAICLIICIQVAFNIINSLALRFFENNPGLLFPSYTEFSGFFLVGASFLGLAYALRDDEHIRVLLVVQTLSTRMRLRAELFSCSVAIVLSASLTYYTAKLWLETMKYNDLSIGMIPVPLWIPQSSIVLGSALLCLAFVDRLYTTVQRGRP